jgi:hypothetical protein
MPNFYGKIEAAEIIKCHVSTAQRYCRELWKQSDGHIELIAAGWVMDKIGLEMLKAHIKPKGWYQKPCQD